MRRSDQKLIRLEKGTVLQNRYVIEEEIGYGGFGITYRAMDTRVDIPVAVKQYLQYQLNEKNVRRETKMAAKFYELGGIAAARDYFTEGEHAYIVMEYVRGMSVKQYISENGRMSGGEVLEKIRPLIRTLAAIHKEGVIHRDISSDNLMITNAGQLKLVDFGTARFFAEHGKSFHTAFLKHGFTPLEQCQKEGKQGPWTDVYALCATVYFMITGLVPDHSLDRLRHDPVKSLCQISGTGLSGHQAACIMKGLEVWWESRYQSMGELYGDLYGTPETPEEEKGSRGFRYFTTEFRTTTFLQELREIGRGKKRKRRLVIAGMGFLVAIAAFFIVILPNMQGAGQTASVPLPSPQMQAAGVSPGAAAALEQTGRQDVVPAGEGGTPAGEGGETFPPAGEKEHVVEDYTGLTRKEVKKKTATLRKAGLKVQYKPRYSEKKEGTVISQTPKAGTTYQDFEKMSLVLVVSRGQKPSPAPTPTRTPGAANSRGAVSPKIPEKTKKPGKTKKPEVDFSGNLDEVPGD